MKSRSSFARFAFAGFLFRAAIVMGPSLEAAEPSATAAQLQAGVARLEITDRAAGPVNDPCFAKVLVL